jgi:hypothetical protein
MAAVVELLRRPIVQQQRDWLTRNRPDLAARLERAINAESETAP